MGWLIELAVDWVWDGVILAVWRRYGVIAGLAAVLAPFVLLASLVLLVVAAT